MSKHRHCSKTKNRLKANGVLIVKNICPRVLCKTLERILYNFLECLLSQYQIRRKDRD